jgi:DNA-binding NtrC family response regulator
VKKDLNVLLVEDKSNEADLLSLELRKNYNLAIRRVETEADYLKELNSSLPDVIISDFDNSTFNVCKALLIKQQIAHFIPFILINGSTNEKTAFGFIKDGADDYLTRDQFKEIPLAINSAIEKRMPVQINSLSYIHLVFQ